MSYKSLKKGNNFIHNQDLIFPEKLIGKMQVLEDDFQGNEL